VTRDPLMVRSRAEDRSPTALPNRQRVTPGLHTQPMLALQRGAGNRAVSALLGSQHARGKVAGNPDPRATLPATSLLHGRGESDSSSGAEAHSAGSGISAEPAIQRCGDHMAPGCACAEEGAAGTAVQRDVLGDVGAAVSGVAADVAGVVSGLAADARAAIADSPPLQAAIRSASSLASSIGGAVSLIGGKVVITAPRIPLMDEQQTPLVDIPALPLHIPLLGAGTVVGPVILEADIGIEIAIRPEVMAIIGPAEIRAARLELDPLSGTYVAAGQLHAAGSQSLVVSVEPGLDAAVNVIIMAGEVPIPLEADLFGGMRLALRGTGLGSLDESVSLGYRSGGLFLDSLTDLRLGARIDAELDATVEINIERQPVCVYTWPLANWLLAQNAEQFTVPLSLGYSSGTPSFSIGPVTSRPIPVTDIEARVPSLPRTHDCTALDSVIAALCRAGVLPASTCHGHGGGPGFDGAKPPGPVPPPVGPVPVLPPGPVPVLPPGPVGPHATGKCSNNYPTPNATPSGQITVPPTPNTSRARRCATATAARSTAAWLTTASAISLRSPTPSPSQTKHTRTGTRTGAPTSGP
jgi:hypothetical protein